MFFSSTVTVVTSTKVFGSLSTDENAGESLEIWSVHSSSSFSINMQSDFMASYACFHF